MENKITKFLLKHIKYVLLMLFIVILYCVQTYVNKKGLKQCHRLTTAKIDYFKDYGPSPHGTIVVYYIQGVKYQSMEVGELYYNLKGKTVPMIYNCYDFDNTKLLLTPEDYKEYMVILQMNILGKINFFIILLLNIGCSKSNTLEVVVSENFNANDFKIELIIIYSTPLITVYENNKIRTIPDGYGENDFIVSYKDSLCARIRHFKTDEEEKHNYKFRFYEKKGDVCCLIEIIGLCDMKEFVKLEKKDCYKLSRD